MEKKTTELKEKIKVIAKSKKLTLKKIYEHLGISQAAFDKSFYSKNFEYSKKINDIALFLGVTVEYLTGKPYPHDQTTNIANDRSEVYNNSIAKNNFFQDEKTEIKALRIENELLKQMIAKQEKEIEFLRGLLSR